MPTTTRILSLARERLELAPERPTIQAGAMVRDGRRIGKVIAVVRRKALVMWQDSRCSGFNAVKNLRLA